MTHHPRTRFHIVLPPQPTTNGTSGNYTLSYRIGSVTPSSRRWIVGFAIDEWGHRHLGRFHRPLLGRLCDWCEREASR